MQERERTIEEVAAAGLPWHALASEEALARLDSSPAGLDEVEVVRRRALHGANVLLPGRPVSPWLLLVRQVRGVVPALLAATAVVSLAVGDAIESAAVAAVLLLDVAIGFVTEWRAHRALDALRRLQTQTATVRRAGRDSAIDASELVVGDVMLLAAGTAIAADARVLAASELRAVEAPLTGESFPVDKSLAPVAVDAPLAERSSMVFKGTMVGAGSGLAVVTAVGRGTEVGRVGELVEATREGPTPLELRLDRLGRSLLLATLVVAVVVAVLGLLRGVPLALMVETSLALAVAAVPESLPAVATIVLAVGMRRMARRHALVRRLPAVETLGSTTVLCTDKTGTLTAGGMSVARVSVAGRTVEVIGPGDGGAGSFRLDGRPVSAGEVPGLLALLTVGALANRARVDHHGGSPQGDPTEIALLAAARQAGLSPAALLASAPEVAEVPFQSERMLMATFHRRGDAVDACVKGAPGRLLDRCSEWLAAGGPRPLDEAQRSVIRATNAELAGAGLRVLALARRQLSGGEIPGEPALHELVWLGMVGMEDPAVTGVEDTLAELRGAGIRVVMLTGDQTLTASVVARRLGILRAGDEVLEGRQLTTLADEALRERLGRVTVLSRLEPAAKLRVVEALQRRGEIVAMLGDGINDGPALRRADIGLAMGLRGTDVAKETAGLVLADDRLQSVAAAVAEGRVIRDNVEKVLFYLFSCNLAEVAVVGGAVLAGLPMPMTPLQILWLNLVTDVFPALGLAMEPAEPDVMRRPPRPSGGQLLSPGMLGRIVLSSVVLAAATLGLFGWMLASSAPPIDTRTAVLVTLSVAQLLHVWNAGGKAPRAGRRLRNGWLWGAVAAGLALQLAVVYVPVLARPFGTAPPTLREGIAIATAAALPLLVGQLARLVRRRP